MLKPSPILSPSAHASPTISFRHAPGRSSQESPLQPIPMSRRPSSRSSTSLQSPHLSKHPITVDASAQHHNALSPPPSSSGTDAAAPRAAQQTPTEPPPPPRPQPLDAASAENAPAQPAASGLAHDGPASNPMSPQKRRGSPTHALPEVSATASGSSSAGQAQTAAGTSKRLRPDSPPVKILPQRYELCAVEDVVELIAHMINELIATNDAIRISSGGLTRFHSRTAPGISVRDYLHRLARHATLTPPLLLAMVYYIDRLCALYQEFTINTLTVHRFLITAATVAAKGLSDAFWNNTTYARVGGVRVAELKLLELEFLYRVDWKIVPNPEVLVAYYRGLVERTPGYTLEDEASDDDSLDDAPDEDGDEKEDTTGDDQKGLSGE